MTNLTRIPRAFFTRASLEVARELLGVSLVHIDNGQRISGIIVETEAYIGEEDQACHARSGRTRRTEIMYGPPGFAYVYFTYGMHWLLNCVTESEGFPAAVLVRALDPTEGLEIIAQRRAGRPSHVWTDGPAKLCQALGINETHNGQDLCTPDSKLFLEFGEPISDSSVTTTPRVGLNTVPESWKRKPWRFKVTRETKSNH